MKTHHTKKLLVLSGLAVLSAIPTAQAANWLTLQGTEPPQAAPSAKVWGFIQAQYTSTDGTKLPDGTPFGGQNAVFNTIAPDQMTNEQFHIQRARAYRRAWG